MVQSKQICLLLYMFQHLEYIKGIHPGFIIGRELKKRQLQKSTLARKVNEHLQTIVAITKARRNLNTALALKIEKFLQLEEGILMVLQTWYDIEQVKKTQYTGLPDLTKIRPALFWDTSLSSINWQKQKNAVIKRVLERGNEIEKREIERFYGSKAVNERLIEHAG